MIVKKLKEMIGLSTGKLNAKESFIPTNKTCKAPKTPTNKRIKSIQNQHMTSQKTPLFPNEAQSTPSKKENKDVATPSSPYTPYKHVFKLSYAPDRLLFREKQCQIIDNFLLNIKTTKKSSGLYINGQPGSGKTVIVKERIQKFQSKLGCNMDALALCIDEEDLMINQKENNPNHTIHSSPSDDIPFNLHVIWMNCMTLKSPYQIYGQIIMNLKSCSNVSSNIDVEQDSVPTINESKHLKEAVINMMSSQSNLLNLSPNKTSKIKRDSTNHKHLQHPTYM